MLLLAPGSQLVSWVNLVAWILPGLAHQWAHRPECVSLRVVQQIVQVFGAVS
jgi:hypothetical protein